MQGGKTSACGLPDADDEAGGVNEKINREETAETLFWEKTFQKKESYS